MLTPSVPNFTAFRSPLAPAKTCPMIARSQDPMDLAEDLPPGGRQVEGRATRTRTPPLTSSMVNEGVEKLPTDAIQGHDFLPWGGWTIRLLAVR